MSRPVIEVENLSKRYRLGTVGATTLASDVAQVWRQLTRRDAAATAGEFWALRDVSFQVQAGEVIGLVGGNGAGKSTLLKILARITEPTRGRAILRGRVASLLEVGTGFQEDLTGRENVYLNGAILGMKRAEIAGRFDQIIAFSEVEQFIDTPVKHYSSGMRVRLAFAIAAHLQSNILIVDEVLAVGDVQFQKKCLSKMDDVTRNEGRTVLFVSHSMTTVAAICPRCILLDHGRLVCFDQAAAVITRYLSAPQSRGPKQLSTLRLPGLPGRVQFTALECDGPDTLPFGSTVGYRLTLHATRAVEQLSIGSSVFQMTGECVGTLFTETFSLAAGETRTLRLTINHTGLSPGDYYAGFGVGTGDHGSLRHDEDIVIGMPTFRISPVRNADQPVTNWHPNWGPIHFTDCELERLPSSANGR